MTSSDTWSAARWWLGHGPYQHEQNQQVTRVLVPHKDTLVPQNDDLLDVRQAAARLRVSQKWIYHNYRSLPHVLLGGGKRPRIRFKVADLDAWVSTHTFDIRRGYARARKRKH